MSNNLLAKIRSKDHKILSQVITSVENDDPSLDRELNSLYPYTQDAIRIGITGPPGSGKSTLIDKLITVIRNDNKSIGVITVDPTSPFSGGALLGDRVRMNKHALDRDVFIRSMGSRGIMGGLAKKSCQVADILSASGMDIIIFETIGVGQAELEIVQNVDIVVVVFVPESGDEIQFMKAGPVEIGDIFVINKADRDGAENMAISLRYYLENGYQKREIEPKVLLTIATDGQGINALYSEFLAFFEISRETGIFDKRRQNHYIEKIKSLVRDTLVQKFWTKEREKLLFEKVNEFLDLKISPHDAVSALLKTMSGDKANEEFIF